MRQNKTFFKLLPSSSALIIKKSCFVTVWGVACKVIFLLNCCILASGLVVRARHGWFCLKLNVLVHLQSVVRPEFTTFDH